ncbi:MAG TPA: zinc-ribbon domain-containing protein [Candidatus Limnocylindrales bacterium]|nr:zinc-ribbon domain-containing protein [Candidatus Limnocylindrales bacterium]
MYCDSCGHQLNDDAQFCVACGKQLSPPLPQARAVPVPPVTAYGRVAQHLKILGSLWLVYGLMRLMEMFWIVLIGRRFIPSLVTDIVSGVGGFPSDFPMGRLISGGLVFAGFWVGAFAVLEMVAAWGLFERRPWARILALVLGFLALLRFPFGTALGIYTLWVLLPGISGQEYDRLASDRAALTSAPAMR